MPITPSLRHCSNKYKLAREGEKDKEKDEDFEKGKVQIFCFLFFVLNVLESDFEPLCDGTTRRRSLADLRLLEGM